VLKEDLETKSLRICKVGAWSPSPNLQRST
jgi:hypothetical protein